MFSKIPTKRTFVRLLFLKLNQSQNLKKIFWGGLLQKPKTCFSRVKSIVFKTKIPTQNNLHLCFNVKGSFMPILTKKILIFRPPGIF